MALLLVKLSSKGLNLQRLGFLFFLLVSAFLHFSCSGEDAWERQDPSDFLRAYLYAVESQDHESVWAFLSVDSQTQLAQRAQALAALAKTDSYTGKDMLRLGHVLSSTREYKKFDVLSNDGQTAQVDIIRHEGTDLRIELKREQGFWKIALPLSAFNIEKEER